MTASLFNALGNLHQLLTVNLAAMSERQTGAALRELQVLPGFRTLESLNQLATPERLTGLLFHDDRYEAVASRLGFPEDALRGIFGAETRANRLLPAIASATVVPREWRNVAMWKGVQKTMSEAVSATIGDWRAAKVRRIAPRAEEPIGVWLTQRTVVMGSTELIAECFAQIQEMPDGVEEHVARMTLKLTDYQRRVATRERVLGLFRAPFLGTLWNKEGSFECGYAGMMPKTGDDWQAFYVPSNLAVSVTSRPFARKKTEALAKFFETSQAFCADLLGCLLAASER